MKDKRPQLEVPQPEITRELIAEQRKQDEKRLRQKSKLPTVQELKDKLRKLH